MGAMTVGGVAIDAQEVSDIFRNEGIRRQLGPPGARTDHLYRIARRAQLIADSGKNVVDLSPLTGWLRLGEWCRRCGVPDRTARFWAADGRIKAQKVGRTWWVAAGELPPARKEHDG